MMAARSLDQEHYYYFVVLKASQNTSERFENSFVNTVVSPGLYEILRGKLARGNTAVKHWACARG